MKLDHVHYLEPVDKGAKILEMINDKPSFSRKKLASYLKEAGLFGSADYVWNETLRNSGADVNDPSKLSTEAEVSGNNCESKLQP